MANPKTSLDKNTAGITMQALAALAGVSTITVSRALGGSPLVSGPTRDKIRRIAAEQGYRLNISARNLRRRCSNAVALVLDMQPAPEGAMARPCPMAFLGGMTEVLTRAGYAVILSSRDLLDSVAVRGADGAVVLDPGIGHEDLARLRAAGLPLVVWNPAELGASHAGSERQFRADGIRLGQEMLALLEGEAVSSGTSASLRASGMTVE